MTVQRLAGAATVSLALGCGDSVAPPALEVTTESLPSAQRLWPYEVQLTASASDVSWRLAGGLLPNGLVLSGGVISGTPVEDGSFDILVEARAGPSRIASRQLELIVDPAPVHRVDYELDVNGAFTGWQKKFPNSDISRVYVASVTYVPPPGLAGIVWDSVEGLACVNTNCDSVIEGELVRFNAERNLLTQSGDATFSATLIGHRIEEYGPSDYRSSVSAR